MWFQHLAWNHVCMISYLHCLVFKEHCFLTSFVKSLSDFRKFSVWVSFYIIPHSVPFVKNFLKYFLLLLSKQPWQAFSSKALLCCISATTMYILQQICTSVNTFIKFFHIFSSPNKFWFAELPIYSNIVTESRYVSGFSKYSLRS